jgi:hypothetical protein
MIICEKNGNVCEYNDSFLTKDNVIIASYFSTNDIEYLRKIGITPIIFQGTLKEAIEIFKDLEIKTTKPQLKSIKRGIGCGRGYSNGKGFGKI